MIDRIFDNRTSLITDPPDGRIPALTPEAQKRVAALKELGYKDAQLYGADSNGPLGGLNAFFLLLDRPAAYALPEKPLLPQRNVKVDSLLAVGSALLAGVGALVAFRERGSHPPGSHSPGGDSPGGDSPGGDSKDGGDA